MPRQGDHFRRGEMKFSVTEASDRRVLTVRVEGPLKQPA
jgi:Mg2+/Co2+ transporter CorC